MAKIDCRFVNPDTHMDYLKIMGHRCLAFNCFPGSKRKWIGIAVKDVSVALALSNYFKQMAKHLEKDRIAAGESNE